MDIGSVENDVMRQRAGGSITTVAEQNRAIQEGPRCRSNLNTDKLEVVRSGSRIDCCPAGRSKNLRQCSRI